MLKAISLWQPWASLWAATDAKIHETRSWPTKHRGVLAIHASKTAAPWRDFDGLSLATLKNLWPDLNAGLSLPSGAVIAVITLEECVPTESLKPTGADYLFGNWTPGRFAWRRGPVIHRLQAPVPCRGFQGIWNLDPAIEAAIHAQLLGMTT